MEQWIADQTRRYTEDEYLRFSETSDVKYEFREGHLIPFGGWERDERGRIIGMAGGTAGHNDIAMNLGLALGNQLTGTPCRLGGSDLRVGIARTRRYCYPDLSITCEPRQFHPPDRQHTLVNPQVIIEVLSPSTADDDRGEKMADYIGKQRPANPNPAHRPLQLPGRDRDVRAARLHPAGQDARVGEPASGHRGFVGIDGPGRLDGEAGRLPVDRHAAGVRPVPPGPSTGGHPVHRRPDGSWTFGPWAEGLDALIAFPSLGVTVPLAEVYAGVAFPRAVIGTM